MLFQRDAAICDRERIQLRQNDCPRADDRGTTAQTNFVHFSASELGLPTSKRCPPHRKAIAGVNGKNISVISAFDLPVVPVRLQRLRAPCSPSRAMTGSAMLSGWPSRA